MHGAAERGDAISVWSCWKDGEDVDMDDMRTTPLMLASENGHLNIVIFLMDKGAEVDKKDWSGQTALAFAVTHGHLEVAQTLVDYGAEVNQADEDGKTPMWLAAKYGHDEVFKWLDEVGASKEIATKTRLMKHCASENDDPEGVRTLVETYENDVNAKDKKGGTPLMYLCASNETKAKTLKLLVEDYGADVNAQDKRGRTPLMLAANRGDVQTVDFLLRFHADVNITDKKNRTAREYASNHNLKQIQGLLLSSTEKFQLHPVISAPEALVWFIPPTEIEIGEFESKREIGGDFVGTWLDAEVVIKVHVPLHGVSEPFDKQVECWFALRHPNIQKLYGAVCERYGLFVCEHMTSGSLKEYVTRRWSDWDTKSVVNIYRHLYEAALGLQYLHERDIVHGDVRLENICSGIAKLANMTPSTSIGTVSREKSLKDEAALRLQYLNERAMEQMEKHIHGSDDDAEFTNMTPVSHETSLRYFDLFAFGHAWDNYQLRPEIHQSFQDRP